MPPPLPKVSGDVDIILDLYTHRSLRFGNPPLNEDYGDIDRLAELGQKVFELAVTIHYFSERPVLDYQELTVCLKSLYTLESIGNKAPKASTCDLWTVSKRLDTGC